MTPHDHRGRLPYGRTWPHRGSAPGPIQALAEFLVAPARLVQQTIGLGAVAKTFAGVLVLLVVMLGTNTAPIASGPSSPSPQLAAAGVTPAADPEEVTFLILGVDSMQDRGRSDTVLLVRLYLKQKRVHILSIPRDTYAVIEKPGGIIEDKLNHSYRFGGAEMTKQTVEKNLGIKVDYYGVVDYDLFRKAIDLIGCVELDVEKRYYYVDKAGGLKVDLFPGKQQLCGDKALQYVRFRHDAMGDEGRIIRQQKFLGAALAKLKDPKVVTYVGFKLPSLLEYVTTDVPSQVAMGLLWKVKEITAKDLSMASVPGEGRLMDTPIHRQRLWFYEMDKARLEKLKTEWFFNPEGSQDTVRTVLKEYARRAPKEFAPTPAPTAPPAPTASGVSPAPAGSTPPEAAPGFRSPFQPPRTNHKKASPKPSPSPKAPGSAKPAPAPKASAKASAAPVASPSAPLTPAAPPAASTAAPASPSARPATPAPVKATPATPAAPPAAPAQPPPAPATVKPAAAPRPATPAASSAPEDDPMGRDAVDKALERGPSAPADPAIDAPLPASSTHPAAAPAEPEESPMEEAQAQPEAPEQPEADPFGSVIQKAQTARR